MSRLLRVHKKSSC